MLARLYRWLLYHDVVVWRGGTQALRGCMMKDWARGAAMSQDDGRVWNVYSYPDGKVLHTAGTYEACESWRRDNSLLTYICPQWPNVEVTP